MVHRVKYIHHSVSIQDHAHLQQELREKEHPQPKILMSHLPHGTLGPLALQPF